MKKHIAVCINMDTLSLGSLGNLKPDDDPTYQRVDERLVVLFEKRGIRVTLFIVGQDLESATNRRFVEKWASAGHEIANHSFSHPLNFASLGRREIEKEIAKTDVLISGIINKKSHGFSAPGWAQSDRIASILQRYGYSYDVSPFPSPWIYPLLLKQWWGLRDTTISDTVWKRKDFLYPLFCRHTPWIDRYGIAHLPLPTVTPLRIPVWHTGWFLFGERFRRLADHAIHKHRGFYYLFHPADVLSEKDIPKKVEGNVRFERLSVDMATKRTFVEAALDMLLAYQVTPLATIGKGFQ